MAEYMSSARSTEKTATTTTRKRSTLKYEWGKKLGNKIKKSTATANKAQKKPKIYSQWRFDASMSLWEWQNEKYNLQFGQCSKHQPHTHTACLSLSLSVLSSHLSAFSGSSLFFKCSIYCWIYTFFSLYRLVLSLLKKPTFVCMVIHINDWMYPKCKRYKKVQCLFVSSANAMHVMFASVFYL